MSCWQTELGRIGTLTQSGLHEALLGSRILIDNQSVTPKNGGPCEYELNSAVIERKALECPVRLSISIGQEERRGEQAGGGRHTVLE
jgi:hypothetical protein